MKHAWCVGLAVCTGAAWAALGERPDGPATASQRHLTSASAPYWHLQDRSDAGTTVHQYVDRRGLVFAVSWSGPFQPDLQALLGQHFGALVQPGRQDGPHAPLVVRRPDLVVISSGRMGAFSGRAWLPRRLPRGFDTRVLA